jgi:retron-type reverse transcriptase
LKDEARFMSFVSHGGWPLVESVMTTGIPAIRNARAKLLRMARISESPGFRMTLLRLVLVHSPSLLGERPAMRISDDEFDSLLRAVHSPAGIAALFRLKGRRGGSSWESCFRQGRCIIPISRAIRKQLPELRQRLEELEAARFLRRPGFKSTLRRVLAGKTSAGSLGVPQRMLRHLIPWARKTWKDKPTLAVAHELALAFSVADARYLAFLCTERWKSPDRNRGGHVFDHHYRVHPLPKKSGGNRLVTVPSDALKRLQRRILRSGLDEVFLHPAAHGFRSQRSILTNALPHVGHPCVVNVDIKSFFPSTRYPLILHACSLLAGGVLSEPACHVLADICSHAGGLPTGAPTSPALANLILRSADTSIAKAAKANNITYTRYADDLTFSGESNVLKILPFVSRVLGQLGYLLDDKKTNIFRRGRRQMVTGLVVNEKANLPRRIRRRLRAAVHQASNGGKPKWHGKPISKAKLLGRLGHLALVQPKEAAAFREQLKRSGKTENTTQ